MPSGQTETDTDCGGEVRRTAIGGTVAATAVVAFTGWGLHYELWPWVSAGIGTIAFALSVIAIRRVQALEHGLRLASARLKQGENRIPAKPGPEGHEMANEKNRETNEESEGPEPSHLSVAADAMVAQYHETLARHYDSREQAGAAVAYQTDFLSRVSHELRNPLNSILGFADVLLDEIDGPLSEGQREDLHIIRSAGNHLFSLFNDVLDLSAAATGRLKLRPESVDVADVVESVIRSLALEHETSVIDFRADVEEGIPRVFMDPERLRQVLDNLTGNALKFTREGEIVVGARCDPHGVRIFVQDTGVGMSAEEMKAIFSEFGSETRSRKNRSPGLGLAISRKLVELSGGEMTARSEERKGSIFIMVLPETEAG